ncbi:hypothetical protein O3P69_008373 [Scylla paramamosain]|uniref:TOG domain-containing protein n=1 Tax=Scylla paramamosain TaxID=85552 RepID=A0AAW0SKM9_SCYPA
MATFENFPTPNDTYEVLLPLACTPPPQPAHESPCAPASPTMGCPASLPVPASPPRSVNSRPSYSDYLASFRAASRCADAPIILEPPSVRPTSASPDYSCLPKDKIHFILSLKEALKRHGTVPDSFNKLGFFEEVHKLLADEVWQIRNEATLLILDLLPYLGPDLDACMAIVLPHLVPNLGDSRQLLRRSSLRLLKAYAAISRDPEGLVDDIITYGVSHRSRRMVAQVMVSLEHLLREEILRGVDLAPLARALLAKLHDAELQPAALLPLLALRGLVGDATFTTYLSHLSADSREKLDRLVVEGEPPPDDDMDVVVVSRSFPRRSTPRPVALPDKEYGVVDAATMNKIRHSEDWKTRADGCEELRGVVKGLEDPAPLLPHLPHFLQLLDSLFDDNNFRISLTVLDIFRLLLDLLDKATLLDHLRQLVHAVRKHVGDSKVVVRIENMRVFRRLLQAASPAAVVPILCDALSSHRSSRVREDSLNLIIYALMTFPSYEFDLRRLAERVSVSIADPKRRVRHAALECLAAIAQFLGPAKLGPLMAAVDRVEEEEEAPGALEAVQARLARRQLPKVSPDGLIEFSLVVPAPGRHSSLARVKGADVDWVMAGAGGGASGSQGVGWPSSLSASFTASDSYVNTLAFTHPQSSPTQRPRHVRLEESLHRKRSISDVTLDKTVSVVQRGAWWVPYLLVRQPGGARNLAINVAAACVLRGRPPQVCTCTSHLSVAHNLLVAECRRSSPLSPRPRVQALSPALTHGVSTAHSATGRRGAAGSPGSTSALRRPISPIPDSPLLLGARLSPGPSPGRSRSLPGLQAVSRGAAHAVIRRERSLSSVTAVFPPPTAHVPSVEGSRAPWSGRGTHQEENGMYRMLQGAPHWDASAKKMWSPGPPASREPIRLPFLDVTPTTVLQRLRDAPDAHHVHAHAEEDRGLALWTTDTIDLNRTAPSDLAGGYRGVYLGRLRQETAVPSSSSTPYPRGSNVVEKGYSLLPNKYGAGGGGGAVGLGSARGGERPASRSPSMPRRINALAPLDQGEGLMVSRAPSTRSIIPPLSAVSRRSHVHDLRHHPNHPDDFDEEDDDVKSDFYDDDEGEDAASEEEVEEEEHVERDNMLLESQISRPKSSATTRDSGISVFSSSNDGETHTENGKGVAAYGKERSRSRYSKETASPSPHPSSPAYSLSSGDEHGRSSFDGAQVGRRRKGADATSPSRHSLPNDALLSSGLGVVGKGVGGGGGRSRTTQPNDKDFRNFDYESDFETDEEDIKLANTTLTKMKLLRKKQENMREIDRRRQDRETRRAQEERVKKYRQLEMQHSQNSLQPSSADSGDSKLAVHPNLSYRGRDASARRTYRRSPRHSPTPSPTPLARIPKSKSHNANLSKSLGKASEKRHRSLERNINTQVNGVHPRETFRTPQLVKRGHPPVSFGGGGGGGGQLSNSLGNNRRYAKRPPDRTPDYPTTPMETAGLRIAKPASSCFKQNLEPFASPPDALRIANERLNSNDWEGQVEGIEMLVRLVHHHPNTVLGNLRNINMSLMKQAKNLRSQVSRAAIQAFTCFFDTLRRNMEGDAEKIAAILLNRTVDTNKFLQLDSNHALDAMLENITPSRAIPAILQEGLGHRNPAVRTNVARLLAYEVERLGPSRVLSGQKDITDRVLPAAAKLAQEGSLETRQYAKQIFHPLIQQGQFDAILKKYVPANDIRNLQKLLDNLSNEGRTVHDSARTKFATGSRYTRTM